MEMVRQVCLGLEAGGGRGMARAAGEGWGAQVVRQHVGWGSHSFPCGPGLRLQHPPPTERGLGQQRADGSRGLAPAFQSGGRAL